MFTEEELTLERPDILEVPPRQRILEALMSKDTTISMDEDALEHEMVLNMGPQHPSTHGVLRVMLRLDGETVLAAEPEIGFLHTGIEKQAENLFWQQAVTVVDRADYLAPLSNSLCYVLGAERLLGIHDIPPRAQVL